MIYNFSIESTTARLRLLLHLDPGVDRDLPPCLDLAHVGALTLPLLAAIIAPGALRRSDAMAGVDGADGPRTLGEIASYHAHVYYDPATTRSEAEQLRSWIGERFSVTLGRWHDVKVGPHDKAMYQVAFAGEVFPELVPWLMLNHGRLSVLIHPNTTNPKRDHEADPIWIGPALAVHADKLPDHAEIEHAPAPNTNPVLRPRRTTVGRGVYHSMLPGNRFRP